MLPAVAPALHGGTAPSSFSEQELGHSKPEGLQPLLCTPLGDQCGMLGTVWLCWGDRVGAQANPVPCSGHRHWHRHRLLRSRGPAETHCPPKWGAGDVEGSGQRRRAVLRPLGGQCRALLGTSQAEGAVSVPTCTVFGHQAALPALCPRGRVRGSSPELPPPDSYKAPVTAAAFCINSSCHFIQELHLIER